MPANAVLAAGVFAPGPRDRYLCILPDILGDRHGIHYYPSKATGWCSGRTSFRSNTKVLTWHKRHHISKLSLRKKKSCVSVATQESAACAAPPAVPPAALPTAPTPAYSNLPHGQEPSESDDNSEKKPLIQRLLKKQPSIPASLKTLYTPHSRYNSAETLERDVREDRDNQSILTRIQTNTSTATTKVGGSAAITPKPSESTIATTPAATPYPSTTVTPQPSSSVIRETAIEREEALARWRASSNPNLPAVPPANTTTTPTRDVGPKQVYPESSGRHNREMEHLPESQRQEDHAYPASKPGSRGFTPVTERGLGSGIEAVPSGGRFATKAGMFWAGVKARMWWHREERKVERLGKKI
ncbi:hypothetical protein LTR78_005171 [Recurvomyces mirabilis]|uniref:Uncharacterized protein n=1 Tax=Recurvomyces mirabilis TaxID=574656 RepID=A0AAE0WN71_9PEZI|nr:hypothetical protein LTR78_005171 [Recurvomyces mirabilis]KAK5157721.1 hypothetical protein LTS14_003643 [Recurvomyces mirabilis]